MTPPPDESYVYQSRTVGPPTRNSTAEFVAGLLRAEIADGTRAPGDKLPESELCELHEVSRNTLREAFQQLTHERLVVHNLNRGFKVRRPTAADLADIYRVRRVVECGAIRSAVISREAIGRLKRAVADGERAAELGDGRAVGSANIQFHRAIGAMADSARVDEMMDQVLAELRLVFHVMGNLGDFHLPYLPRNKEIVEALIEHDIMRASDLLSDYLDDAEKQLRTAYEAAAD